MKVVTETLENFKAIRKAHPPGLPLHPLTVRMLTLKVDSVMRIKDHDHKTGAIAKTCYRASALNTAARRHGWRISTIHDGPDLLVMRVS